MHVQVSSFTGCMTRLGGRVGPPSKGRKVSESAACHKVTKSPGGLLDKKTDIDGGRNLKHRVFRNTS